MKRPVLLVCPCLLALAGCPRVQLGEGGVCGDGVLDSGELCDDGNLIDSDGCSPQCELEALDCPEDMVSVPADPELGVERAFCIDRYEASRADATAQSPGDASDVAVSQPGVMPWYTTPMGPEVVAVYQGACRAAGKRLCQLAEWVSVCTGPARTEYVFGDLFDAQTCNCVDTWCDAYCAEHPELTDCPTESGCGYATSSFRIAPTGAFVDCVSPHGAFDVCGNLWEVVLAEDTLLGYEVRGGAFNCAGAAERLKCSFNATWSGLYAGFRCCRDPG